MKFFAGLAILALIAGASADNYGYASKGGIVQATKGGMAPTKGVVKTFIRAQPTLSKTRYPTKGLQPQYEQKIEQQVQQQEEQVVQQQEEQVVQQKIEQVQQKVEQYPETTKQVKKVGVTKWEQKIEQVPAQRKSTYVPRKNLKPIVQKIEQQIQQQQEEVQQQVVQQQEEEPVQQQVLEQKVISQRPVYNTQTRRVLKPHVNRKIDENVRQVPQSFDGNWE